MTNWRAVQVPVFHERSAGRAGRSVWQKAAQCKPCYMAMGAWAPRNLRGSQGGAGKAKGRAKRKIHVLPFDIKIDKKGYTIL